jgi:hypothetical protein
MATEVILKDEATCRGVEYALWYHASCTVEGTLDEECWKAADEVAGINEIDDGAMPSSELADARLNTLVIARADIERVRDAGIGDLLELETSASALAEGLAACKEAVDGAPRLLKWPATGQKVRDLIAATGEAAVALLAELEKTAVAA